MLRSINIETSSRVKPWFLQLLVPSDQDGMPSSKGIFNHTEDSGISMRTPGWTSVVLSYTEKSEVPTTFQKHFIFPFPRLILHKVLFLSHDRFMHLLKPTDQSAAFAPAQSFNWQLQTSAAAQPASRNREAVIITASLLTRSEDWKKANTWEFHRTTKSNAHTLVKAFTNALRTGTATLLRLFK